MKTVQNIFKTTITILLLFTIVVVVVDSAQAAAPQNLHRIANAKQMPKRKSDQKTAWIICHVFRADCHAAINVAWCESRFQLSARNGQYRGIFQMGNSERITFGHGSGAWKQARAARRYQTLSGWKPWECQP